LLGIPASSLHAASNRVANVPTVVASPALLTALAEEMRTNHPALRATWARTNAAGAGVQGVRTWEDPRLRLGGMAANETMRADQGDIIYGVEQKLPLWGKPQATRRVAQAELAVESAGADYTFQLLRSELAKALFRAALAEEVRSVGGHDLSWLKLTRDTVESRYRVGQSCLPELLQIQNELDKRADQLRTDERQLEHERFTLNRLLNRKAESSWPSLALPPVAGPVTYDERLVELAMKYEPRVQMMRQQINQAQAGVDLARRQRYPDVNVGVESRNYSGNGSFRQIELFVSLPFPWANRAKYSADIFRQSAKRNAAELDLADYTLGLRNEVHLLTVRIDAARRQALLYLNEIIPRSEKAQEAAQTAWQTGGVMFRDVLEAHRMLLDGQLMYARAVSEQYLMLTDLVLCCGLGDLEALSMIGAEPKTPAPKP
jgi:outer membrane protein, heavy metal efflux system